MANGNGGNGNGSSRVRTATTNTPPSTDQLAQAVAANTDGVAVGPGKELFVSSRPLGRYLHGEDIIARKAKELLGHTFSSHKVAEVLAYLRLDCRDLWDRPPVDVINTKNGLLNVTPPHTLSQHNSDWLSPIQIGARFDATARCPNLLRFLKRVLLEDQFDTFIEWAGYLLTPDTRQKKMAIFVGPKNSGKSTAMDVFEALLGADNVAHCSMHDLCENRFAPSQLVGKLANIFSDLDSRRIQHPAMLKILTGRDTLNVERKFGHAYPYRPFTRLLFSCNTIPGTSDRSSAYFARFLVFSFPNSIPESEIDLDIIDKLTTPEELSGLLNLALDGLARLRRQGHFTASESSKSALAEYRRTADPILAFLYETITPDPQGFVSHTDLYQWWTGYAQKRKWGPGSQINFNRQVRGLFGQRVGEGSDRSGTRGWRGIALPGGEIE